MVPLSFFLVAWIVLLIVFGGIVLLTLIQALRHGLPSAATYVSTFIFLLVSAGVIAWTSLYLLKVDWSVSVNLVPESILPLFGVPQGEEETSSL